MAKSSYIHHPQYLCLILCVCLACMAVHIVVDSTGGFGSAQFLSQGTLQAGYASHAHDDDFLPPILAPNTGPALQVARSVDPDWKAPSQATTPLLPPPKSI